MKETPNTAEQRKALHLKLLEYAEKAVRLGSTKGLSGFVQSYRDPQFVKLLTVWIEKFTPIQKEKNPGGHLLFQAPRPVGEIYDLAGARLNPYYSLQVESLSQPRVSIISANKSTSHYCSDRELDKRILKKAVNDFLHDGTLESKEKLIRLIHSFPSKSEAGHGHPFLQGGLPSLGKR